MRRQAVSPHLKPDESIAVARAHPGRPIVLADRWDNPGGGVPGDGTLMIETLLKHPDLPSAVGVLWDPIAVEFCRAAGVGGRLWLRIGGKATPVSGRPVDAHVVVKALSPDLVIPFEQSLVSLGPAAAVSIGDLDVVLATGRAQTFSPEAFTALGIDLAAKKIVVVKSSNHFYAAFSQDRGRDPLPRLRRAVPAGPREDRLHPRPPAARARGPAPVAVTRAPAAAARGRRARRLAPRRHGQGRARRRRRGLRLGEVGGQGLEPARGRPAAARRRAPPRRLARQQRLDDALLPGERARDRAPRQDHHGAAALRPAARGRRLGDHGRDRAAARGLPPLRRPPRAPGEPAGRPRRGRRLLRRPRGRGRRRALLPRRLARRRRDARRRAPSGGRHGPRPRASSSRSAPSAREPAPAPATKRSRSPAPSPPRPASRSPGIECFEGVLPDVRGRGSPPRRGGGGGAGLRGRRPLRAGSRRSCSAPAAAPSSTASASASATPASAAARS